MTRALRAVAVLLAIAALIDPAFAGRRAGPAAVEIRAEASPPAAAIRARLAENLRDEIAMDTGEPPAALVVIGNASGASLPAGVPISIVSVAPFGGPNVRVVRAAPPEPVLPGQEVAVAVQFEAIGLAGRSSTIDLEQDGVRLARVEHPWTGDAERFTASLRYAPPSSGIQRVSVVARPLPGELSGEDNAADLAIVATARTLRVAAFEPRPSWAAAFVRRALEADPVFDVSSLVRPSRRVEVRAGAPPHPLTRPALAPFDAVLAGAPEELSAAEVGALDAFAQERGGAVILLPDRRPSGPYVRLFPSVRFEDALLEKPLVVQAHGRAAFSASEWALPRDLDAGGVAIASVAWQGGERAAVASWPRGVGRVIVSGALDAWRYRAGNDDAFGRFWTGTIAAVAAAAPPRLAVSVRPALAAPGQAVTIRAAVRTASGAPPIPPIDASLVGPDGSLTFVRLWPLAEPGVFEGTVSAPDAGRYEARASLAGELTAGAPLLVAAGVRRPPEHDREAIDLVAAATGGVVTDSANLAPLESHLRGLGRRDVPADRHPTRSVWWGVAFAAALCGEWALRRRGGAR
jgi:hypothetical protein